MKFKIAVAQINLGKTQSEIFKSIIECIRKAKEKNVDLICFPECSLQSGSKKNEILLKKIAKECETNKVGCIVAGNLKEENKVYNTAVLISSKGKITGKHKKVHICDNYPVCAGSSFDIFETPFCKIGIVICWDIHHPEVIRSLAEKGAELIFCPMYWEYDLWAHSKNHLYYEKKILNSLILARAYENLVYVVFCNPYNPNLETLTPLSAIAEPHKIIKQIFNREGMITADIDLDYLRKIRKKYKKEYNRFVSSFA